MATIQWLKGINGLWTTGADWSGGVVPGSGDDVVISAAPANKGLPYTIMLNAAEVANSVTLSQQAATLAVQFSTLTVNTDFSLAAGTLELEDGTLSGGNASSYVTASASSSVALQQYSNIISKLQWRGALNLVAAPYVGIGDLILVGVSFTGANGTGFGSLSIGDNVSVSLEGSDTLANVQVKLGNDASLQYNDTGSLTLASNTAVSVGGSDAIIDAISLINNAVISVSGAAASLTIQPDNFGSNGETFTNTGSIAISAGGSLAIDSTSITNSGLITVGSGSTLSIGSQYGSTFTNTGSITVSGGTLVLDIPATTAQLAAFGVTNGTLGIGGALDNTGATLSGGAGAGAAAQNVVLDGGSVTGGTIVGNGSFSAASGTFSGVTFDGTLAVQQAGTLTVEDGFTLNGIAPGTNSKITLADASQITFLGNITLDHVTITDAGESFGAGLTAGNSVESNASTLTLGAHSIFNQAGAYAALQAGTNVDAVVNKGVINLNHAFGEMDANGLINLGRISISNAEVIDNIVQNAGTIVVGNDAVIDGQAAIGGSILNFLNSGTITSSQSGALLTFAGGLDNTGTIAVSNGTLALQAQSFANTGNISVTNGLLQAKNITATELNGIVLSKSQVDVTGSLQIDTAAPLRVGAGTSLGTVNLSGGLDGGTIVDSGNGLVLYGNTSFDNVTYQGTVNVTRPLTNLTIRDAFAATAMNGKGAGRINLTGGGTVLDWQGSQALDNATLAIGNAALTYAGHAIGAPTFLADSLNGPTMFGADLTVQHAGTFAIIGGAGGGGYSAGGGTINSAATIRANLAHGQLSLEGASFTTTGLIAVSNADTVTEGATAFTNAGAITIGAASTFAIDTYNYFASATFADTPFINAGSIALFGGTLTELTGGGSFSAVPILNTGTVRGAGLLDTLVDNVGAIIATGGTLTVDQAVSGTGSLVVGTGATLDLTGAVGSGQRVTFGGASGVLGLAPAMFHARLVHFAAGDAIDLANTAATAAAFSGNSIRVTLSGGGTISLGTTSALSGSLATMSDGHGGTLVEFAGSPVALAPVQGPVFAAQAAGPAWAHVHMPDGVQPAWPNSGHVHVQVA